MDRITASALRKEYFAVVEGDSPSSWWLALRVSSDGATVVREVTLNELESIELEVQSAIRSAYDAIEEMSRNAG